jgi:predicted RNA binding protein YcfA (HicA-like mRNA interferase family)
MTHEPDNSHVQRTPIAQARYGAVDAQGRSVTTCTWASLSYPLTTIGFVKVAEVVRLLERDGWRVARTRGSHRQFKHPAKPGLVTVAGKPSTEMPRGTLNSILKQPDLKPER